MYKLICMSFDGEFKTEREIFPTVRDAFVKCFRYVQTDSMGLDTIFYFPQMRTEIEN